MIYEKVPLRFLLTTPARALLMHIKQTDKKNQPRGALGTKGIHSMVDKEKENSPRRLCVIFGVGGLGRRLGLSGAVRRIGRWLRISIDGETVIR